jgi:hypothetical protein
MIVNLKYEKNLEGWDTELIKESDLDNLIFIKAVSYLS